MLENVEKSIDIATEAVKQQLNLASGIIAASAILSGSQNYQFEGLRLPLVILFISIIFGILYLLILADALSKNKSIESSQSKSSKNPLNKTSVRLFGLLQLLSFLVGIFILAYTI